MVLFNEVKTCSHKLMSMDGNPVNEEVESLRQRVTVLETLARNPQVRLASYMHSIFQEVYVHQKLGVEMLCHEKPTEHDNLPDQ